MESVSLREFKNEEEEQQFPAEQDSTEYVDWSKARRSVFPIPRRRPAA
ncbi:MAG: CopG family antitoxin [Alkalispirochaetaceae bacterium]